MNAPTAPNTPSTFPELIAPADWQCIDFVADLHLQEQDATWQTFVHYLQTTPANAIVLMGDILELWAGDDALQHPEQAFERLLVQTLKQSSQNKKLFFMAGNRDFLIGQDFCRAAGLEYLNDPCVLHLAAPQEKGAQEGAQDLRVLLSHGDVFCIADTQYMQFRQQVRNPAWQHVFLQQPLEQRLALARQLRQQSSTRKNELGVEGFADVDAAMAEQWMQNSNCTRLIHGHTHKPRDHNLANGMKRYVLSDWDMVDTARPRAEVLRLESSTHALKRISLL